MSTVASSLDFILYLEGVPIPMVSATVTITMGLPISASISIPPTVRSQEMLERTSVHLFYSDRSDRYPDTAPKQFRGKIKYKLLFEGEVISVGFHKQDDSRSTVLMCQDHTNNFDYAHKFMIQGEPDIATAQVTEFMAGGKPSQILTQEFANLLNSPVAGLVSKETNIAEGIKKLIEAVFVGDKDEINTNEFLKSVEDRFKISDRILLSQDDEIQNLVTTKTASKILSNNIGRNPSVMDLSAIINSYLDFIYYSRISLATPPFNDEKIKSLYLVPNIFFSPPPKCNVLFPDHIRNIGYTDNFLQTPTRMLLGTTPIPAQGQRDNILSAACSYAAPRELSSLLPTGAGQKNILHEKLTSEEKRKGVVPVTRVIGSPEYILLGNRGTTDKRNYLLEKAEYELELRRAATRNIDSMSGPFNPEVIVGLPGVVLDKIMFIFGMISSVSHRLDASSGATTTYTLNLTRRIPNRFSIPKFDDPELKYNAERLLNLYKLDLQLDDEKRDADEFKASERTEELIGTFVSKKSDTRLIDIMRRIVGDPPGASRHALELQYIALMEDGIFENLPENSIWINANYNFETAGSTYKELFGCGSLVDDFTFGSGTKKFSTMSEAARFFLVRHGESEDPYSFTSNFTERENITTQADFDKFYSLEHTVDNSQPYKATGPFTPERQQAILDYATELKTRAHLG